MFYYLKNYLFLKADFEFAIPWIPLPRALAPPGPSPPSALFPPGRVIQGMVNSKSALKNR